MKRTLALVDQGGSLVAACEMTFAWLWWSNGRSSDRRARERVEAGSMLVDRLFLADTGRAAIKREPLERWHFAAWAGQCSAETCVTCDLLKPAEPEPPKLEAD